MRKKDLMLKYPVQLVVRIREEDKRLLEDIAHERRDHVSDVVRDMLKEYLRDKRSN